MSRCRTWSLEKSNTSSDSSFRICMLFSQMTSPVFDASTSSGMNPAQLCGHSCFRICDNER